MPNGGKRPGAGRKKGSQNKATLEKKAVAEAFNQRVLIQADALFNAQLTLAVGSVQVFRVDEVKNRNGTVIKREHTLITDSRLLKEVLDEGDGGSTRLGDDYYIVTGVIPNNQAIDSMLNRTLGKPKESMELTGANGGPVETKQTQIIIQGVKGNDGPG